MQRGKEMMTQENINDKFAEKCRKGLENTYGGDIPTPKCMVKRSVHQTKRFKLF